MNLGKKKVLAAKALKVGKNRVQFNVEGLSEIKEAITKEDIKTLKQEGIITIKPLKGRQKVRKRKTRRGPGKIKKKVNNRKQVYVKITRKLRAYLKELKSKGALDKDFYKKLRKKIRMRDFKSKANLKDYLKSANVELEKQLKSEKSKLKTENIKSDKLVQADKSDTNSADLKDNKKENKKKSKKEKK